MREIEFVQQNWPGALSPEAALAALHGGNAESLLKSYQLDVDRAWKLVQTMRQGPQVDLQFGERIDFDLGDPMMQFRVPAWMPRMQDNVAIWKTVVADYTKTDDYDRQPPGDAARLRQVYRGLEQIEQRKKAMALAMQEQGAAMQLGRGERCGSAGSDRGSGRPAAVDRRAGRAGGAEPVLVLYRHVCWLRRRRMRRITVRGKPARC
jgi:hypothetical protein